ncbi:MAG: preprotein translocase subunit YajC [Puniceicoccales bacterium]|jgi:preprotein translocase subunit YajC|nr:preprotein translocase subunit YajC [Puniceicoccales bacterium]
MFGKSVFLADGAQMAPRGGGMSQLLVFALLFVGMWFLFIAPQRKRQKQHQEMLKALHTGDYVLLASGLLGKIIKIKENLLAVEIAKGVQAKVMRSSVQRVMEELADGDGNDGVALAPEVIAESKVESRRTKLKK